MGKNPVREAFDLYDIPNPHEWLKNERLSEKPAEEWGYELYAFPALEQALGAPLLDVVAECCMRTTEVTDSMSPETKVLIQMLLDTTGVAVYIVDDEDILIVDTRKEPKTCICIVDNKGSEFSNDYCGAILLHSWENNPDREKGLKARQYLCDAVERLMTAEAT